MREAPALHGRFGRPYTYVERCPSTQRLLDGAPEGAVAVTDEQTEGRGRLGRTWHAPAGSSLLFSIVLTPAVSSERLPELSLVAGAAVAEAIAAETGLAPTIKHPNDVLIGGRKVAGVLAEAAEGRVVLGIGINVSQDEAGLPPGSARRRCGSRAQRSSAPRCSPRSWRGSKSATTTGSAVRVGSRH